MIKAIHNITITALELKIRLEKGTFQICDVEAADNNRVDQDGNQRRARPSREKGRAEAS